MCNCINNIQFMHIEDKCEGVYEVLMKSVIIKDDSNKHHFFTIEGAKIDTYKYIIYFNKNDNTEYTIESNKENDLAANR